jgi:rubrerythrin
VTGPDDKSVLVNAYRRERLSLLQYVAQAAPFAAPTDRTVLDRVRGLADAEAGTLDELSEYLDQNRVPLPPPGAFPTAFTNYNFVAVRKLVPKLVEDEAHGLAALERDAAVLPSGEARSWLERLAESKRMHLNELEKMAA